MLTLDGHRIGVIKRNIKRKPYLCMSIAMCDVSVSLCCSLVGSAVLAVPSASRDASLHVALFEELVCVSVLFRG
jgi:hypothetical protein